MKNEKKLSVAIITFNEEKNIERCLKSVKDIADEIVVVDSESTDATEEICKKYGVNFIVNKFRGNILQWEYTFSQTQNDYVLCLDADEELSEKLYSSILKEKECGFLYEGYTFNRCTSFCGKWIRHGAWYPDKKLRIVNKHKAFWGGEEPHGKLLMEKNAKTLRLEGDLNHYSYYTFGELIIRSHSYTTTQANTLYKVGKKSTWFNLLFNPFHAFLQSYFLKFGFLDGKYGFILAISISYNTFTKYVKVFFLNNGKSI